MLQKHQDEIGVDARKLIDKLSSASEEEQEEVLDPFLQRLQKLSGIAQEEIDQAVAQQVEQEETPKNDFGPTDVWYS